MKPRRVVLTVEVETSQPLRDFQRSREVVFFPYRLTGRVRILQISANVIREKKRKGKR